MISAAPAFADAEVIRSRPIQQRFVRVDWPMASFGHFAGVEQAPPARRGGRLLALTILLALTTTSVPALARTGHPEIASELGPARMLGASRYQVLAWSVFDAELWSANHRFSWDEPFAVSLTYRRDFERDALVARSVSGMAERAQIGSRQVLSERLRSCFADVRAGDRLTGVSLSADTARFFLNGRRTCDLTWPGFSRSFFGIWLDAQGEDRRFSARLRGTE